MWNPLDNWAQQGSFTEPVAIPAADPADAPQVCLSVNASWLPYVIGALQQLVQPTTWVAASPAALLAAQTAATELIERFGTAETCMALEFRLTSGCILQYSLDGGATWTDVPGWSTSAPGCFTGPSGPTGPTGPAGPSPSFRLNDCILQYSLDGGATWTDVAAWATFTADCITPGTPGNPGGNTTLQNACNIAAWMATEIIQNGVQTVLTQIQASKTLVQTVQAVLGLVAFIDVPVAVVLELGTTAFNLIQTLNQSDLQTGLDDAALLVAIKCAIYGVISSAGQITAANWAAVQTAVDGVSFPNAATQSAIQSFVNHMTADAALALQQQGPIYAADCADCSPATWCDVPCAGMPIYGGTSCAAQAYCAPVTDGGTWWLTATLTPTSAFGLSVSSPALTDNPFYINEYIPSDWWFEYGVDGGLRWGTGNGYTAGIGYTTSGPITMRFVVRLGIDVTVQYPVGTNLHTWGWSGPNQFFPAQYVADGNVAGRGTVTAISVVLQ